MIAIVDDEAVAQITEYGTVTVVTVVAMLVWGKFPSPITLV